MKKKLIIMVSAPLTNRWATHFCTDELSQKFDLEYWDCSLVAYPAFKGIALERNYVRTPQTMTEFKTLLRALPKDTLIMSDIHLVKQNFGFHRLMARYFKNRVYVNFWSNMPSKLDENDAQPTTPKKLSFKQRIYQISWLQVLIKFIRYGGGKRFWQFYEMHRRIRECEKFTQEEKYCENLYTNHIITCLPHHQYSINHPDYEKYLQIKDDAPIKDKPFIVFVDEYYPYHPDFIEINPEMDLEHLGKLYYHSMNHFFDVIEKQTGMKVIIAAHPMADYSTNPYGGREILMYKTAELIRDSAYVCMHHGFCLSYIALFDKPMCFISNEAIRGSRYCYENVMINANMMHMPVVDSDRIDDYESVFSPLPKDRRELYINRFFDLSINKRNAELYEQYLNQIHQEIVKTLKK